MRRLAIGLFLALWVGGLPARAERPAVAVLDTETALDDIDPAVLATLTDTMRGATTRGVGSGARVMTREVMASMATPEQLRCTVGKCIATIARILQARYVVGAKLMRTQTSWMLKIEAYDSSDGAMLGTTTAVSADPEALIDVVAESLARAIPGWFRGRLESEDDSSVSAAFESEPTGAIVFVDGQLKCKETPCRVVLGSGAHDVRMELALYKPQTRTVDLAKLGGTLKMTLEEGFARIVFGTQPRGTPVSLDEGKAGVLTGEQRLDAGGHQVVVADRCFERSGLRFSVKAGERRTIPIEAQPIYGGARFRLQDAEGNARVGRVLLEGTELCRTPCTARVPICADSVELEDLDRGRRVAVPLNLQAKATVDVTGTLR